MKIVFATNNKNKLSEIRDILRSDFEIVSLQDIGCHADIPETGSTLEENAMQKARYIYDNYNMSVFADDTGLMVDALGGEPGVYSARFAGPQCNAADNMALLLEKMDGETDRKARFMTVIALCKGDEHRIFTGTVTGTIAEQPHGT